MVSPTPGRFQCEERVLTRQGAEIVGAQAEFLRLKENVHQAQSFHAVIIVIAGATNHKSVAHIQRIRFNIVRWIEICGLDKSNTGIAEPNRPDSEPRQCYGNNIPTGFVLLHFQITCNLSV